MHLEDVPQLVLENTPLAGNVWLDRYVVELAEWGALLKVKGFECRDAGDEHPMAWDRIYPPGIDREKETYFVDRARAETLFQFDEQDAAAAVLEPYVYGNKPEYVEMCLDGAISSHGSATVWRQSLLLMGSVHNSRLNRTPVSGHA